MTTTGTEKAAETRNVVLHMPVLTKGASGGTWVTYCYACSEKAQAYVDPCAVRPDSEWPPHIVSRWLESR